MMPRRPWVSGWVLLGLLLACGESSVDPPAPPDNAGTIALQLSGAEGNLSAVSIRLVGEGLDAGSVAFAAGEVHLLRVSGDTLTAALFGDLGNQRLLTIEVADARDLSAFPTAVIEALGPDNELAPVDRLQVTLSRP